MNVFRPIGEREFVNRIILSLPEISPSYVRSELHRLGIESYDITDVAYFISYFEAKLYEEGKGSWRNFE